MMYWVFLRSDVWHGPKQVLPLLSLFETFIFVISCYCLGQVVAKVVKNPLFIEFFLFYV